jgi:hypothetical protein
MTIFGASSLHPKIPFPAPLAERELGYLRRADGSLVHCGDIPNGNYRYRIADYQLYLLRNQGLTGTA